MTITCERKLHNTTRSCSQSSLSSHQIDRCDFLSHAQSRADLNTNQAVFTLESL
jgi:hypothetical protein